MGKEISKVDLSNIRDARKVLSQSSIRKIDMIRSSTFSSLTGDNIYLKLECLQKTGSFKVRGATSKISSLPPDLRRNGVIAASAGNHAQGVAYASSMLGLPCTIVMPKSASPAKIAATRSYGAKVMLHGNDYDESSESIAEIAQREGKTVIPAFEDPHVIAGQGTIGLEILEDLQDIDEVYVPVGGGGLIAGIAVAIKSLRPGVRVVGVESSAFPTMRTSLRENRITKTQNGHTIADGIAVKTPGELTFDIVRRHVDEVVLVDDLSIVKAMFLLMERSKIVAEPAGAASLAYLMSQREGVGWGGKGGGSTGAGAGAGGGSSGPGGKNIVSIVSGGNVDMYLLGQVVAKGLMQAGRLLKVFVELPDKPGALKKIVDEISKAHVNIVEVVHDRLSSNIPAGTAGVYLSLEFENRGHASRLVGLLKRQGIKFRVV